jgi:hypothetical protein
MRFRKAVASNLTKTKIDYLNIGNANQCVCVCVWRHQAWVKTQSMWEIPHNRSTTCTRIECSWWCNAWKYSYSIQSKHHTSNPRHKIWIIVGLKTCPTLINHLTWGIVHNHLQNTSMVLRSQYFNRLSFHINSLNTC